MKRHTFLAFILSSAFFSADAYDFAAQNPDGVTIYYNIVGDDAQVTFERQFIPTESYSADFRVPSSVTHEGITYPVTSIGKRAFFSSPAESISLPESITSIEDFAFAGCSNLSSLNLPRNLSAVGSNIFDGCFSLTDINVASDNNTYRSIGGAVYDRSGSVLVIYPQGRDDSPLISPATECIGRQAFFGCTFMPDITIPQGVKEIGDNAFYFCNSLSAITIPVSVSSIGRAALSDCLNLESINVDTDNPAFSSIGGCLLDKNAETLLQSPAARVGSAAIPETVARISDLAFFRNIGITTAIIPQGVAQIGEGAFTDCLSLSAVSIPESTHDIGHLAFAMCPALEAVYLHATSPSDITIPSDAFAGIDPQKCVLYVPAGSSNSYREAEAWSMFDMISEYDGLQPQQIVWDTEYDICIADSVTVTLDAVASSGLPVSYVLAPESVACASLSGNRLTLPPDAKVTVTATQNGNGTFAPADAVTRRIEARSSIDSPVAESAVRVFASGGKIIIADARPESVARVYDIAGRTVYSGTDRSVSVLPGNIYMVNIDGRTHKIPVN